MPWEYTDVVRRNLTPESRVLDIGTGGGEVFGRIAPCAGPCVAIDSSAEMLAAARETFRPREGQVSLARMRSDALGFEPASFDVVLDRHVGSSVDEVVCVLRPGGVFITQQVGGHNTQALFDVFDWGSNGAFWAEENRRTGHPYQTVSEQAEAFRAAGCSVVAYAEYDVPWFIQDVESLVFFLKTPVFPERFDAERHLDGINRLLAERSTPRGIELNEHRELLIVRKDLVGALLAAPRRLSGGPAGAASSAPTGAIMPAAAPVADSRSPTRPRQRSAPS